MLVTLAMEQNDYNFRLDPPTVTHNMAKQFGMCLTVYKFLKATLAYKLAE